MHSAMYQLGTIEFGYNPDLSGDVKIYMEADTVTEEDGSGYVTVTIPGNVLESFVLDRLRDDAIGRLENAEGPELRRMLGMMA